MEIGSVVNDELYGIPLEDNCLLPFLYGAIRGSGDVSLLRSGYEVSFSHTDKRFIDLLSDVVYRLTGRDPEIKKVFVDGEDRYVLYVENDVSNELLERCFIIRDRYTIIEGIPDELFGGKAEGMSDENSEADRKVSAAKRALLRGLYLSCGVLRVPEDIEEWSQEKTKSGYMLAFNLNTDYAKEDVIAIIAQEAEVDRSSILTRTRGNGVFIKNSQAICNLLTAIGSNIGVLQLYEVITNRKMKNDMNRMQNFEIANIDKTVRSSSKQVAAIKELDKKIGIKNLPEGLRKVCELRLANEEAGLEEIAGMFTPPVSKSCVNHRLRRIMQLAAEK